MVVERTNDVDNSYPLSTGAAQGHPEIVVDGQLLAGPQQLKPLDIKQQQFPEARSQPDLVLFELAGEARTKTETRRRNLCIYLSLLKRGGSLYWKAADIIK
ncbi:hypothetical protein [Ruegeria sp. HKCCE4150]|uniref:hypothetical protein n=1 Tax=Ruegeria sp. HKCCE4150 TaxID=2794828 RepID=UPI001AE7C22E|nr:hypothetical protein [Ruegeria sp. HKCCE4150]